MKSTIFVRNVKKDISYKIIIVIKIQSLKSQIAKTIDKHMLIIQRRLLKFIVKRANKDIIHLLYHLNVYNTMSLINV